MPRRQLREAERQKPNARSPSSGRDRMAYSNPSDPLVRDEGRPLEGLAEINGELEAEQPGVMGLDRAGDRIAIGRVDDPIHDRLEGDARDDAEAIVQFKLVIFF